MGLWFTRESVRAVDRAAIEEYALPGIVLMENAARALLDRAMAVLDGSGGPVVLVCGPGNNGGDGLALARLLHNASVIVRLVCAQPTGAASGDAGINARVCERMGLTIESVHTSTALPEAALVVDGLLGTGLTSAPRDDAARVIEMINAHPAPTLSVDLPSGLDCDTGDPLGACVRADETVTFVGMKLGFANPRAQRYTGTVTVGDIGAPRGVVERFGRSREELCARE